MSYLRSLVTERDWEKECLESLLSLLKLTQKERTEAYALFCPQ